MGRIVLMAALLFSFCFACDIDWQNSMSEAKKISAKTKKPILLFVSSITCPYCTKMSNETLSDERVCKAINAAFVPLSLLEDSADMPRSMRVQGVPTIAFINSSEKEMMPRVIGFRNTNEFLADLAQRSKGSNK